MQVAVQKVVQAEYYMCSSQHRYIMSRQSRHSSNKVAVVSKVSSNHGVKDLKQNKQLFYKLSENSDVFSKFYNS